MIGAMPAVAVRHERRKQKSSHSLLLTGGAGGGSAPVPADLKHHQLKVARPSDLVLRPHKKKGDSNATGTPGGGAW